MTDFYRAEIFTEVLLAVTAWLIAGGGVKFKLIFLVDVAIEDISGTFPAWVSFGILALLIFGVLMLSAFVYVIEILLSPKKEDDDGLLSF